jgi:hypothetical protein
MTSGQIGTSLVRFALPDPNAEVDDWDKDVAVYPGLTDQGGDPQQLLAAPFTGVAALGLGGAWLKFLNLSGSDHATFHVIPEYSNACFTPANGEYNVDGFWYRPLRSHWYKMPDFSLVWIYKDSAGYLQLLVRSHAPGYPPFWQSAGVDPPKCGYPW